MDDQRATELLGQIRTEKQAQTGRSPAEAIQNAASQGIYNEALRDAGNVALMGLGVGAAARGTSGLYNLLRRNLNPVRPNRIRDLPLPLPVAEEEEKQANGEGGGWFGLGPVTQKEGLVGYYPAMFAAGTAGAYGGWKGVDALLDRRREVEQEDDLESAKSRFREALLSQHDAPVKLSADSELSRTLDELFDRFEKDATLRDTLGQAGGLYGVYALATGIPAGIAAYSATRKKSRRHVLEKALAKRRRRRSMMQPNELYARPVPVPSEEEAA